METGIRITHMLICIDVRSRAFAYTNNNNNWTHTPIEMAHTNKREREKEIFKVDTQDTNERERSKERDRKREKNRTEWIVFNDMRVPSTCMRTCINMFEMSKPSFTHLCLLVFRVRELFKYGLQKKEKTIYNYTHTNAVILLLLVC